MFTVTLGYWAIPLVLSIGSIIVYMFMTKQTSYSDTYGIIGLFYTMALAILLLMTWLIYFIII